MRKDVEELLQKENENFWKEHTPENRDIICAFIEDRASIKSLNSIKRFKSQLANIRKLSLNIHPKSLKDVTSNDLKNFFSNIQNANSQNLYGTDFVLFYKFIDGIGRRDFPERLNFFERPSKQQINKREDPDKEKMLLLKKDYDNIIANELTLQNKALWECFYLSGVRPSELLSMTIDSIKEGRNGVEIIVWESKTKPRQLPLSEYPEHLIRWVENHPNKEGSLWLNCSNKSLQYMGLSFKFSSILKKCNIIPKTLKTFRRTRATIMFRDYDDTDMAKFFGWSTSTVAGRRNDYDLRTYEELKEKVFAKTVVPPTRDVLRQQKEQLEHKYEKQITDLQEQVAILMEHYNELTSK